MVTSEKGVDFIKNFEGLRLEPYKAVQTEKYLTIGYGHYGPDVLPNSKITKEQATNLLKSDLKKYEAKVNKYQNLYHFNQNQFDAMVSFAYNVGSIDQLTANGCRSIDQIAEKITAYNRSGGQVLKGLTVRRMREKLLFLTKCEDNSTGPTLTLGDKSEFVAKMQSKLKNKGYYLVVDGVFGKKTLEALKAFQAENDLTVDGTCGKLTWSKLLN